MSARTPAPTPGNSGVQIAGLWDMYRISALTALALALPFAATLQTQGVAVLAPLAMAMVIALGWPLAFALLRRRPMGLDGTLTAVLFVLLLPNGVPLWQQAVALSFGVVIGEQVFGGRGRNFLNPAVVALAFLLFSFPAAQAGEPAPLVAGAAATGGLVLLLTGVLSWRVVAGFLGGLLTLALLIPPQGGVTILFNAGVMLGLVFAIGDPVASACTNLGRWFYGALTGALVVLLGPAGADTGSLHPVVFAALLAGIFAPLIDQGVVWANVRRRRRRHG